MEYFPTYGKVVGHLSLDQQTREPKILVTCAALVDPIAAATIDFPIAEALLKPHRKKHLDVAHPNSGDHEQSPEKDKGPQPISTDKLENRERAQVQTTCRALLGHSCGHGDYR